MGDTSAGGSLAGAVSEHASSDASSQADACALLCASIMVEKAAAKREELGREGYRQVLGLAQSLEQAVTSIRSAFEAASDRGRQRAAAGSSSGTGAVQAIGGGEVIAVWEAAKDLEEAITIGATVFNAFVSGINALGPKVRPKVARVLNTQHLRELVSQGIATRTAAKQFLTAVLLETAAAPATAEATGLVISDTDSMGRGLFASAVVDPGCVVGEYRGHVLDAAGLAAKYPAGGEGSDYLMKVSADRWIDAASEDPAVTNHTRFINHAEGSAVNCAVYGDDEGERMVLFTLREISEGEQLFFDYGPAYWEGRAPAVPAGAATVAAFSLDPEPDPESAAAAAEAASVEGEKDVNWDEAMEELD